MTRKNILAAAAALTVLGTASSQASLTTGLNAYYTFDTDATDQAGNFNGTVVGATHTSSGKIGGAYSFSGNQYIDIGVGAPLPVGNDARSISMWVKPTGSDLINLYHAGVNTPGQSFNVFLGPNNGGYGNGDDYIYIQRYYEDVITTQTLSISPSDWSQFVISYDGGNPHDLKFYLNGSLVPTDQGFGNGAAFDTAATEQSIGGGYFGADAIIDEVGIWNRGLTTQDVSDLYNGGAGFQPLQAVPEPSTAGIASAISFLAAAMRRRRR